MKVNTKTLNFRHVLYTRRFLVLAVALFVISAAVGALVILVQIPRDLNAQSTITQETTTLSNLRKKVAALSQVNFSAAYVNKDKVAAALPSQKPVLQLLANINAASQQTGLAVIKIDTSPGQIATDSTALQTTLVPGSATSPALQKLGVDTVSIGVDGQGTLDQVNAFTAVIEKAIPLTDVSQIHLSTLGGSGTDKSQTKFDAQLLLQSYYFTQPISVSIDAPLPEIGPKEQNFLNKIDTFAFNPQQQQQPSQIQGGGSQNLFNLGTNGGGPVSGGSGGTNGGGGIAPSGVPTNATPLPGGGISGPVTGNGK